jgi:ribonuclease HI
VSTPDGRVLDEAAVTLGRATNNVAEYRALLLGLERAAALGASEVEVVNDSELIARQVDGSYRVKNAALRPLHEQAKAALSGFDRWSIRSVPRAQNAAADALVNRALDGEEIAPARAVGKPDVATVVRQASELWLELIAHELAAARDALAEGRPGHAAPRVQRVVAVERLLAEQLVLLEPGESLELESPRLAEIESLSGELYEAFRAGARLPERLDDDSRAVARLLLAHDEGIARLRSRHRQLFPELRDALRQL